MRQLTPPVTADALFRMSHDGVRRELVRGEVREMPPPGAQHGAISFDIGFEIGAHVRSHCLGRVFAAETGFLLERDPDTVRAADCAFVRAERLPLTLPKKYLPLAPDLVVETITSDDSPGAVAEKATMWLDCGASLVWVIDATARTVTVHRRGAEPRVLGKGDSLDGEDVLPGFRLAVGALWA